MRSRLRPPLTAAEIAEMYGRPHRHDLWPDHVMRVKVSAELAEEMLAPWLSGNNRDPLVIADLSCGDAAIAKNLIPLISEARLTGQVILGDIAPGYPVCGPVESTISELDHADLFICTETLEHLEDPDAVLRQIRAKAGMLLLSTPDDEPPGVNPEHLWTWDQDDVREMLAAAGWEPFAGRTLSWEDENHWTWAYQIWGCK